MVLDPSQQDSPEIFKGLIKNSIMLINLPDENPNISNKNLSKLGYLDANKIALETIGLAIPNTCIVGAFASLTGLLDFEPIAEGLSDYFSGKKLEVNITCAKRGFDEVKVINF